MTFVVLVTGASRRGGIGRAVAVAFAQRGATVAVHYATGQAAADETLAQMAGAGHASFGADLADAAQCRALIEAVVAKYGRLDVLVNNAAVRWRPPNDDVLALSYEEFQSTWEKTIAINTLAPCRLSFLALRQFDVQAPPDPAGVQRLSPQFGSGRIVNVSSRAAYEGNVTGPAYAASKAGLNVWHTSTAQRVAKDGVYIYNVAPGATKTEMWLNILSPEQLAAVEAKNPLRRLGEPDEVAKVVEFLALDAPPLMTGTTTDANGAVYLR